MNKEEFDKIPLHNDIRISKTVEDMDRELKLLIIAIIILFVLWWRML